jgi:hypothetical protein
VNDTYYALIGDLVASRRMTNRPAVQRRLKDVLAALNEGLGGALAVPLRLTAGDEVQGLLRHPEAVVEVVTRTGDEIHPARFAWGLGAGPVATDLSDDISVVDGPCLHRARDAVREASRSGLWLEVQGLPPLEGAVLRALMGLMGAIRSDWTRKELTYARAARSGSQREVAERFGVNESTVSRGLSRAHFRTVLEGEQAARELLGSVAGSGADGS